MTNQTRFLVVWVVGQRAARAESGNRVQCRSGCVTKGCATGPGSKQSRPGQLHAPHLHQKNEQLQRCRRGRGPDPCWTGRAAGMPERPGRRYKGRVAKAATTGAPTCFCGDSRAPKYGLQHMCQIARQRVAAGGSSAAQESCARGAVAAALTSSCDTAPACCITTMAGGSSDQRNSLVATKQGWGCKLPVPSQTVPCIQDAAMPEPQPAAAANTPPRRPQGR